MVLSHEAVVINGMNKEVPEATRADNSMHDYAHRVSGHLTSKLITLTGSAATQSLNCFSITGSVEILKLYGEVTTATTMANLTAGFFELDDGTAQTDITAAAGITLSGLAVGTIFVKNAISTSILALGDNAAGEFIEAAALSKAYYPFILVKKTAVATYIRWTYTTSDTPIAATFTIYCEWRPLSLDGAIAAV